MKLNRIEPSKVFQMKIQVLLFILTALSGLICCSAISPVIFDTTRLSVGVVIQPSTGGEGEGGIIKQFRL